MTADLTPEEAVRLARILFPDAYQVLAYAPATRECFTESGEAVSEPLPGRVYVRRAKPPERGISMNNPEGVGPTLRAAVRGLARSLAATNADRLRVLDEIGVNGEGSVRYRMEAGPHYEESEP